MNTFLDFYKESVKPCLARVKQKSQSAEMIITPREEILDAMLESQKFLMVTYTIMSMRELLEREEYQSGERLSEECGSDYYDLIELLNELMSKPYK